MFGTIYKNVFYEDKVKFRNNTVYVQVRQTESGTDSVASVISIPNERPDLAETVYFEYDKDANKLKERAIKIFCAACTGSPDGDPHDPINSSLGENTEMDENGSVYATHVDIVKADDVKLDVILKKMAQEAALIADFASADAQHTKEYLIQQNKINVTYSFCIDPQTKEEFQRHCKIHGLNDSDVIRLLITNFMKT